MLNAARPNRIPIIDDHAAHDFLPQRTLNNRIAESSAAIFPFDEFRPAPRLVDQMLYEWSRARTQYPENAQIDFLHRLAFAAEGHGDDSGSHPYRVGELAALIGHSLSFPEHQ